MTLVTTWLGRRLRHASAMPGVARVVRASRAADRRCVIHAVTAFSARRTARGSGPCGPAATARAGGAGQSLAASRPRPARATPLRIARPGDPGVSGPRLAGSPHAAACVAQAGSAGALAGGQALEEPNRARLAARPSNPHAPPLRASPRACPASRPDRRACGDRASPPRLRARTRTRRRPPLRPRARASRPRGRWNRRAPPRDSSGPMR